MDRKSQKVIKNPGGILVRFLQGIKVFKLSTGNWPVGLRIDQEYLTTLKDQHLTERGYELMKRKLDIENSNVSGTILFTDREGAELGYSNTDAWEYPEAPIGVEEWLFGVEVYRDI